MRAASKDRGDCSASSRLAGNIGACVTRASVCIALLRHVPSGHRLPSSALPLSRSPPVSSPRLDLTFLRRSRLCIFLRISPTLNMARQGGEEECPDRTE
jgi:hypothetical protein